jgi:hypothetical protein
MCLLVLAWSPAGSNRKARVPIAAGDQSSLALPRLNWTGGQAKITEDGSNDRDREWLCAAAAPIMPPVSKPADGAT